MKGSVSEYKLVFEYLSGCVSCQLHTPHNGNLIVSEISETLSELHPELFNRWRSLCEEIVTAEFKRQTGIDVPVIRARDLN